MNKLIFLLSLLFASHLSFGQEIPISNGTVNGCGGFLLDTGIAFNDYQNNENFTMTLCAEDPETILNLYWNSFILGAGDSMTIYDGADTSAPEIGVFMGNDLQTTDITSSIDGCITLVWSSDAEGTGNFSAEITCGPPCVRPIVDVNISSTLPWRICVDEEITLDGSPTVFAAGTSLASHTWDFGDNTTDEISWPIVSHSYSLPGAYIVQLFVVDDNDCNSGNTIDVLVEVSTTPSFEGTSSDILACLGSEVMLEGAVSPTEWSTVPSSNFGGALFIPDDQSQCFDSEILVTGFLADQVITEESDLIDFFINFEHSYMGDLTITFICPNGQSMLAHANQGGGTYLGEPFLGDDVTEGVGYDYYWAADAALGTWGDESAGGTLPSGTYSSESPWSNFIGCPLNGVWSIEICDNLFFDNGFIFDWSLTFDPSLYPENLSFTPSIGADCDSTFWSTTEGPIGSINDCNDMVTEFTDPGEYLYTYHAIDNHGCEYTTDVNVEVSEVIASSEGDFTICPDQSLNMNTLVSFSGGSFTDMIYEWTPTAFLSANNQLNPNVSNVTQATTFTFSTFPAGFPECTSTEVITVTPIEGPEAIVNSTDWCPDQVSFLSAINPELSDSVNWTLLSSLDYLGNENVLSVFDTGSYILTAYGCGIEDTDTILVESVPCFVAVPNIFTPNGDAFNNTFNIEGIQYQTNAHLQVFNRWGGLVFEDTNYKGLWYPKKDEISDGTYFYILELNTGLTYEGTVTIMR